MSAESPLIQPLIASAQQATPLKATSLEVPLLAIKGAIGPAINDFVVREIKLANGQSNIPLIIITLDTPGGLSASLRDINKSIVNSHIPIACLVYPPGARAASAGTYLLYACPIAAMAPATTIGAATPVNIASPMTPSADDKTAKSTPSAMEKKVLNDAIAYIRSLAQLRSRNELWAEKAVTEAATLTATEALAENVITLIAESPQVLLQKLDGMRVSVQQKNIDLVLHNARIINKNKDWRSRFIATITDPNIAYILMLLGIYGLLLEFYSPGIGIAGIIGGTSLLIALYALQLLPLNVAGAALLLLGIVLLVMESLMPSFGVFGIGGISAFTLGSIFLFDTNLEQFKVSLPIIASFTLVTAGFIVFALGIIYRAKKNKIVSGQEEIINAWVSVEDDFIGAGYVLFNGERWAASSTQALIKHQQVQVQAINGLTLVLAPATTTYSQDTE
ncbi:nodulation protein NfeD [Colwellia ponticola]|uniref:Nodulation protein NfeD n=2 Tax=Colwellia ponticola TaxID=2304625 RepID=A0A8H2JPZ8_9GAMM|nr:nodulation protein NfeD [Colwellia ponticola]